MQTISSKVDVFKINSILLQSQTNQKTCKWLPVIKSKRTIYPQSSITTTVFLHSTFAKTTLLPSILALPFSGLPTKYSDMVQQAILQKITSEKFKHMKPKTINYPTSPKATRCSILPLDSYNKVPQQAAPSLPLSPINIKLAKQKFHPKKQNKAKSQDLHPDDKKTKRRQKKKPASELNRTILRQGIDSRDVNREVEQMSKLKTKTSQKCLRNSSRAYHNKITSKEELIGMAKTTKANYSRRDKSRGSVDKESISFTMPSQEYLFIGDECYFVNNYCPTKRVLNSFREACTQSMTKKYVPQDQQKQQKRIQYKKKVNIFSQARKEIAFKNQHKSAIRIQRWWRKIYCNRVEVNPEHILQNQFYEDTQEKILFQQDSSQSLRSPFEIQNLNHSPIHNREQHNEELIIASFNSVECLEEHKPKKIQFTRQNMASLINHEYKLPSEPQPSSEDNEEIFTNYNKFKVKENIRHESEEYESELNREDKTIKFEECPSGNLLKEFQQATRIKDMIQYRILIQKGQLKPLQPPLPKVSINTSILAIHSFLVKFFNFYIQSYRDEFINLINMPYGHSIAHRLQILSGQPIANQSYQDEEGIFYGLNTIIDGDKLDEYFNYLQKKQSQYSDSNFAKANLQLERIHSKAVLQYFNQELNSYRPYKEINGVPYPWNNTYKALTFYFVTEENIAEIFQKIEINILKNCAQLAGIYLPLPHNSSPTTFNLINFMEHYESNTHGLLLEYNQDKQLKHTHQDIKKQPFQTDNELFTGLLIQISQLIVEEMAIQACFAVFDVAEKRSIY